MEFVCSVSQAGRWPEPGRARQGPDSEPLCHIPVTFSIQETPEGGLILAGQSGAEGCEDFETGVSLETCAWLTPSLNLSDFVAV